MTIEPRQTPVRLSGNLPGLNFDAWLVNLGP
jgi:hypothetical protein